MLFVLLICLATNMIFSANACKVGGSEFKDFDLTRYENSWHELYHIPNAIETDNACEIDHYYHTDNGFRIHTSAYLKEEKKRSAITGTVTKIGDNVLQYHYTNDTLWSGEYRVIATDYKTYSVLGACLGGLDEPLMWIGFTKWNPDTETLEAAKQALTANKLNFNKFVKNCEVNQQL